MPKPPVTVETTLPEASAALQLLSLVLGSPGTDPRVILNGYEYRALAGYAGKLARQLHVSPPRNNVLSGLPGGYR